MKLGKDTMFLDSLLGRTEYTYHFLKKEEEFGIDVPSVIKTSRTVIDIPAGYPPRVLDKTLDGCREKFKALVIGVSALDQQLEKKIWFKVEGNVDAVPEDMDVTVEKGAIRCGWHAFRGVCLEPNELNKTGGRHHGLKVKWRVVYALEGRHYEYGDDGRINFCRGGDWKTGREEPYTPELEQFLTCLCARLDEMTLNAARWLIRDEALELIQSGARLLTERSPS